jgi:hypothetical protein
MPPLARTDSRLWVSRVAVQCDSVAVLSPVEADSHAPVSRTDHGDLHELLPGCNEDHRVRTPEPTCHCIMSLRGATDTRSRRRVAGWPRSALGSRGRRGYGDMQGLR